MRLDVSSTDLVCIQVRNDERSDFEARLRRLAAVDHSEVAFGCENGTVTLRLRGTGVRIDCSDRQAIVIELAQADCDELADALAEQQADSSGLPLDHSFASLGATISPPEVRDVVVETVTSVDKQRVVDALRSLFDESYQRQAWLAASGDIVSSFSEDICQLFDDTGLATALERGEAVFGMPIDRQLQELGARVDRVDATQSPLTLLESSEMAAIRTLARSTAEAVSRTGQA